MQQLSGKVAVVTGAASGIGLALAERFVAERMGVALADVEEDALSAATNRLEDLGANVLGVRADVSVAGDLERLHDTVLEHFGAAHVLCNNAGVAGHGYSTWESSASEWDWVLGVNVFGVVNGLRAFVPTLLDQGEGHVVNVASAASFVTAPFMGPYCSSKHAVLAISEALFYELAFRGSAVKVTVVCPYWVRTQIMDSGRNWPSELGTDPGVNRGDPGGDMIYEMFRAGVVDGLDPAVLAGQIVDAIRTERFMVLTEETIPAASLDVRRGEIAGDDPGMPAMA